jgi:hypothetical protein
MGITEHGHGHLRRLHLLPTATKRLHKFLQSLRRIIFHQLIHHSTIPDRLEGKSDWLS